MRNSINFSLIKAQLATRNGSYCDFHIFDFHHFQTNEEVGLGICGTWFQSPCFRILRHTIFESLHATLRPNHQPNRTLLYSNCHSVLFCQFYILPGTYYAFLPSFSASPRSTNPLKMQFSAATPRCVFMAYQTLVTRCVTMKCTHAPTSCPPTYCGY